MAQELSEYVPPKVWKWDQGGDGNRFANINRPISGATSEKDLPVGEHPLQLYSLLDAGHMGAEYDAWLINIMEGDQFTSGFVGANPNSKIPALIVLADVANGQRALSGRRVWSFLCLCSHEN